MALQMKLTQGTPEWHDWRLHGIGGSDAPVINGSSPYRTKRSLFFEKTTGQSDEEGNEFIWAKGHRTEALIRKQFEEHLEIQIRPVCLQHDKYDYLHASLDGFDPTHGVLEAKLVGKEVLKKASELGEIPLWHFTQMQHQFMVSGVDFGNWFGHDGKKTGVVIPIRANKKFIKSLEKDEHRFWDDLQNNKIPELSERDYLFPTDESLLLELRDAKELADNAKIHFEMLKQKAIETYNHPKIAGAGLKIYKVSREGSINFKKIPEIATLKPEYLENFRGKGSDSWTVKIDLPGGLS